MKQFPLFVAFDGVDFAGKSTCIIQLKDALISNFNFFDTDLHIEKFGKDPKFKSSFKIFAEELNKNWLYQESSQKVLRMLKWLYTESDFWRNHMYSTDAKVILMDRSIVSFVINWWVDLWLSEKKILALRASISHNKDVFSAGIVVHVDADETTLRKRATERKEELTYVDVQTLNNLQYKQWLYKKVFTSIDSTKTYTINTSSNTDQSVQQLSQLIFTFLFSTLTHD